MVTLDTATTWTRILSVTAGASCAAGAPGPGTRIRGTPARELSQGPWLGLVDFHGLRRAEQKILEAWLRRIEPLLLVRHLLLAKPLADDIFIELTPQALEAMPEGFRDAPRPILILAPAGRSRPERRREYLDALLGLSLPLASAGSELWAIREFDPDFVIALAQLSDPVARAAFRASLDPAHKHLFDAQLPVAEVALIDDLTGGRDEESAVAMDLDALSSLHPQAHPLSVFAAVERAHNRRRSEKEKTQFSARTLEARLSARGFPEPLRECTPEFAAAAGDFLPAELQRLFEASELLGQT
ncbi:MAG TPA: hypothetical protein VGH20_11900 [Myxococcales bacterium]|jgi:hypothetical protein